MEQQIMERYVRNNSPHHTDSTDASIRTVVTVRVNREYLFSSSLCYPCSPTLAIITPLRFTLLNLTIRQTHYHWAR